MVYLSFVYTYTPFGHISSHKYLNLFACGADVRNSVTDSAITVIKDQLNFSSFDNFLNSKMYKKTYLPVIMLCYTFSVGVLVMIGRQYSWDWGTNYWYAVHTKFGITACVWILLFKTESKISSIRKQKLKFFIINNYPNLILIFIVILSLIFSNYADWLRAPYVKIWYESKIPYIYKPDPRLIDADGLTPLFIPLKSTLKNIDVLKKYKLNVFSTY